MGKRSHRRSRLRRLPLAINATIAAVVLVVAGLVAVSWYSIPGTTAVADHSAPPSSAAPVASDTPSATAVPSSAAVDVPTAAAKPKEKVKKAVSKLKSAPQALARLAEKKATTSPPGPDVSELRIASLNILGSNHKGRGMQRAAGEASLLKSHGVDVVGLQEVQRDQRQAFLRNMSDYTMWPQDAAGRQGYRKQILFRTSRFEMVDNGTVNAPFTGMSVPIPYVLLRDRDSGAEFWVVDSHNSPQGRQGERNVATGIQQDLVNRLNDSHPVLLVGDMNEHQSWFCRFASKVPAWSANGGSYSDGCHPPGGAVRIDWIVGSATVSGDDGIVFSGYEQDGATHARHLSDHYLVLADAKVTSSAQ